MVKKLEDVDVNHESVTPSDTLREYLVKHKKITLKILPEMSKPVKTALNTTVLVSTRNYVIEYAKKRDITYSMALDIIIQKMANNFLVDDNNPPLVQPSLTELETQIQELSTQVRYLAFKLGNLPCNSI